MPAWSEEIRLFGGTEIGCHGDTCHRHQYTADCRRQDPFHCQFRFSQLVRR
jgi:hypothetical protein